MQGNYYESFLDGWENCVANLIYKKGQVSYNGVMYHDNRDREKRGGKIL